LSVEDDLLRIFGGERLKGIMERFDLPDDQPIEFGFVSKAVAEAQAKVEGANFDLRKHLLEYDDVLNKQRAAIYKRRQEFLGMLNKDDIARAIADATSDFWQNALPGIVASVTDENDDARDEALKDPAAAARKKIVGILQEGHLIKEEAELPADQESAEAYRDLISRRAAEVAENPLARNQLIGILDMLWMTNLEDLEALQESVGLRAYGQRDPLVEYRQEASRLFKSFWGNFNAWVFGNIFKLGSAPAQGAVPAVRMPAVAGGGSGGAGTGAHGRKIGRNDRCPCGSGKKYKKCHGK
jgi:preprotein translocase subunit SecA